MKPKARIPRVREASKGTHKGRWMRRAEQKHECRKARRHIARRIAHEQEEQ